MHYIPITLSGAEKLREELKYLKNIRRQEIIQSITEAREHGDLKENAEYYAAKEQQSFCEGRIQELETKLSKLQIIDVTKLTSSNRVIFGATISLKNLTSKEQQTYKIVGDDESDFKQNLISVHSPIARGIIGKEKGDIVTICTPGGKVIYKILAVAYI